MRLINVHDYSMKEFYGHDIPAYAVLSHTWGDDEVLLSDMKSRKQYEAYAKEGFAKIEFCCKQAKLDGWDWAWVDTCCIDKTSSAELSEAINSMFTWYSRAMICYAYLVDVVRTGDKDETLFSLVGQSRWFKRGWTLQELIAPIEVEFFDKDWGYLSSKSSWANFLEEITRIPSVVLRNAAELRHIPVGLRMNWAFDRETTREEDMAYCLLGIFDINMPLLYGEGPKAFMRLQEEIMKHLDDHTLFLWDLPPQAENKSFRILSGLLASSPQSFYGSPKMRTRELPPECPWPLVSNRGVQIRLRLKAVPEISWAQFDFNKGLYTSVGPRSVQLAALCCQVDSTSIQQESPLETPIGGSVVALVLWQPRDAGPGVFYRNPGQYVKVSIVEVLKSWKLTSCLILNSAHSVVNDYVYRGLSISQGDCETRLMESREIGPRKEYLLSTKYVKGVLHTVIRLEYIFVPQSHQHVPGKLQAGRLPAWPSDEETAKKRFGDAGRFMEVESESVRVTRPGFGPAARKVWIFEDESLELVLTLSNEAQEGNVNAARLIVTFRPIRR
ncbi:Vegetative incompatibility protein HET-E-1 [Cytospora mali]|uniref:Vegetative incompatibility protein HET-E-1 n=1 Tax=Cytospora mali TaxID=578113 RepID=A0A194WB06_CYTMA|nr:Vegetative incompatibility protein HET-E-1 [Valsa mali]